jgi:hypothetical protein
MSKNVENFFKDLASGMSRRAAFRRLFGGTVAAVAAVLTGRGIGRAQGYTSCYDYCKDNSEADPGYFGQCIAQSKQCPPGSCAVNYACSSGGRVSQCRDGEWVCNQFLVP